jgi:hypothetical protein
LTETELINAPLRDSEVEAGKARERARARGLADLRPATS